MLIATSSDDATFVVSDTVIVCNTLCREVVSAVLHQRSETLSVMTVSSVSDDFTIRTDRNALSSILTELLSNAVRFAPEGTITLSCYLKGEDTIAFAVSDMGPGIAPDDRDRIFTMFTKLDSFTEGIGLGLPLSRHTANLLGGDLVLDDTYTDGTRFVLTLPINNNV
jgi:signal transduction histidine kinase